MTHFKGTISCSFCPASSSAAEKSYNSAESFKDHLSSVHGPWRLDPQRGSCSTCGLAVNNMQRLFEHVNECIVRIVEETTISAADDGTPPDFQHIKAQEQPQL